MGITRFNVYAGLAGLYIIRDAEEAALHLPAGPYEIPLLIQDRNLETAPDGSLTGRLLHKVEDGTMEFFGPFTLVNGTIWPLYWLLGSSVQKMRDLASTITRFPWHGTQWRDNGNPSFSLDSERKTPSDKSNGSLAACVQGSQRDTGREVIFRRKLATR
jgi:hypothetical protein